MAGAYPPTLLPSSIASWTLSVNEGAISPFAQRLADGKEHAVG
jgi:hypothetical protein